MLRSLIVQLCGRRPDSPEALQKLGGFRDTTHQPGPDKLEAALQATTEGFEKVFLVIDALDECPENNGERKILLKLIDSIQRWSSNNLHFLCTSRKEMDIERAFQSLLKNQNASTIDLHVHCKEVDRDIEIFITQTISSPTFASWSNVPTLKNLRTKIQTELTEKAGGMYVQSPFRFMQCLFHQVSIRCFTTRSTQEGQVTKGG
jgi:hypothetical protein